MAETKVSPETVKLSAGRVVIRSPVSTRTLSILPLVAVWNERTSPIARPEVSRTIMPGSSFAAPAALPAADPTASNLPEPELAEPRPDPDADPLPRPAALAASAPLWAAPVAQPSAPETAPPTPSVPINWASPPASPDALPPALLDETAQQMMASEPFDAKAERAAMQAGWKIGGN